MIRRCIPLLALVASLSVVAVSTAQRDAAPVTPAAAETCPVPKPGNGNSTPADPGNGNSGSGNSGNGNGNGGNSGTASPGNSGTSGNGNGNNGNGNGNGGSNGTVDGNSGSANGNADTSSPGNSGNANPGNGNATGNSGNGNGSGSTSTGDNTTTDTGSSPTCVNPEPGEVAGDGTLPEPVAGETLNVEAASGSVLVRQPGTDTFVPLVGSVQLPTGTVLDARNGAVELTSAGRKDGVPQTAAFSGAKFELRQDKNELRKSGAEKAPVTEIVLRGGDFKGCPRLNRTQRRGAIDRGLIAARSKRSRRGLWGSGHGNFRTRGRWGSATVRGTVWQVEDSCAGTTTTVHRGTVDVTDLGTGRTVAVEAGESFFAQVR